MKLTLHFFSLLALASLQSLHAQTAAPLNAGAARATLSQPADKAASPPNAAVKSRTYSRNSSGLDVEVINYANGQKEERPYVLVPLLFKVDTDELLDDVSRRNLREIAEILHDLRGRGARFIIQGHASAEGNPQRNQYLSDIRARKIRYLLVEGLGIPSSTLKQTIGFGSELARYPAYAPESKLQQDRRVLVVRD